MESVTSTGDPRAAVPPVRMLDPWLAALSALLLVIGLGWGLASPRGLSAGESYRIMYLHVPAAMWSMGLYRRWPSRPSSGWSGRSKWPTAIAARRRWGRSAPGGAGQRRGMGQADVGTWWIWDARLTSELVLLFLYAGVIALWHAFDDRRLAGRAAGILVLVGVVNLPIIHYSVYWWNTLHQARPTCSKPSTQACVCRCGSASLPSSRCRSP